MTENEPIYSLKGKRVWVAGHGMVGSALLPPLVPVDLYAVAGLCSDWICGITIAGMTIAGARITGLIGGNRAILVCDSARCHLVRIPLVGSEGRPLAAL